ncbi:MAG TPA: class I SAM-dependent methyltransferase, partial [Acidimicrobiales bacterium]|nr:class I SAM-dependent methyltransferase [Acidimicrobiales bacterium]
MTDSTEDPSHAPLEEPHRARALAESFGLDPERYDRTRPRYPDEMVRAVVDSLPGPDLLDVGIGTGIAARQFRAAGCGVLGVEVDARMAQYARATGLSVDVARFETWDARGRTFDGVIAGQTWHWVDPIAGARKAAEVLSPGGRLAAFWNVFALPTELGAAVAAVYRRVLPGSPFSRGVSGGLEAYAALFRTAADGIRQVRSLGDPDEWRFDWKRSYTKEEWLDQVPTSGGHNRFPDATLAELLAGLGDAIDVVGGSFEMRYTAVVVTAVRLG